MLGMGMFVVVCGLKWPKEKVLFCPLLNNQERISLRPGRLLLAPPSGATLLAKAVHMLNSLGR